MAINSRNKGAKNERNIAKLFEKWTGKKFAKTPASGGLQWQSANSKGDIVCTTEGHYFPFCIECKSYNKIDFSHLLTPGIQNIDILDFWRQAERDALKANKVPILMMRYNGLPKDFHYLALPIEFWRLLKLNNTLNLHYFNPLRKIDIVIIRSTDLFKGDYKEIKFLTKKFLKNGSK